MEKESEKKSKKVLFGFLSSKAKAIIAACVAVAAAAGGLIFALLNNAGGKTISQDVELIDAFWPDAFVVQAYDEPPFADDPNRTNNAFNVIDFGEQGSNGWFYRFGDYKRPERSERATMFDGEKYSQPGATGLEIKNNFVHTADRISPILEWRAAENGNVNITVSYVKNVNSDANPSYPDGVQLLVYKGSELLELQSVPISTTEENFVQIRLENVAVEELQSLYFVVNPQSNNAYDGGSFYVAIADVNAQPKTASYTSRSDNNADSIEDFGPQGSNGWTYMYGTSPADCALASHEMEGEYINCTSPSLTIKKDFIHPSLNHNAILGWVPAVNGNIDLRIKYTKFEQNDGMPDFPDGVKLKAYKNDTLIYEEDVDVPDQGENMVKYRIPSLSVTTADRLYFMVDCAGNSSYDGGALDVTIIDIRGATTENDISIDESEIRQNVANVMTDFGPQGSNGWFFQSGYGDDPFHAYNMSPYHQADDRYFSDNWLEIKRDYVNTGEHDSSAVIKWKVAQNGTVSVKAAYTKMKNEDKNPAWPDGTRVSLYLNNQLLAQQTFAPEVNREITKRLDIPSLKVNRGDYITMVVNGIDNNAYDGGKYEFSIMSTSGLVGNTERNVPATYDGKRVNFASTKDDFGKQGYNGWYYQYGYNRDPFFAVNIEKCENNEKYYTKDGVEIKKDYIVPGPNGKSANVKWIAAETGKINIDLQYTKLKNEDANPAWPDGVTVLLMKNGTVLRSEYFAPLTDREVTKDLSINGVSVNKGDAITMIVDPGANSAYDGGKYRFVIEDADKVPVVKVGDYDNTTSLIGLTSMKQGTDGWWFLEGTSPSNAKVLTKMTDENTYGSRRTEGLEMKKDSVHAGDTLDPIYQWVVGQNGNIDITGSYLKFGQQDPNPNLPDGVTVKIYLNDKVMYTKKVDVFRGEGNDNTISFSFDKVAVKRGDKLSFQISKNDNWAWDGGRLAVAIEPSVTVTYKPGNDNQTVLGDITSMTQGTDGWYFMEGTSLSNVKPISNMNSDKTKYESVKDSGLVMGKDDVHPGATNSAFYRWVVKDTGKIDISGSYLKYGHQDSNPSWPDGVTLYIYHNNKEIKKAKVNVKQGDGNNNTVGFSFDALEVKANDIITFRISADNNNAWDGGKLAVSIEPTKVIDLKPGDDNNTVLGNIESMEQGTDGWYFAEGTSPKDSKPLTNMNDDKSAYVSAKSPGLEMKKDYVHPGEQSSAIYRWVVKEDGKVNVNGNYVKFGHNDSNPDWPDGVTLTIYQNDKQLSKQKVNVKQGDGNDNTVSFKFDELEVKANDILSFQISADSNNAYDAGRLSVIVREPAEEDPNRTNNTVLKDDFSGEQGKNGWYYGMCDWDGKNFEELAYDSENSRYYNNGKPELKADFVEPGQGRNAAYKWIAAKTGTIYVKGEYVKYANKEGTGTVFRIRLNGDEKKYLGLTGTSTTDRSQTFDEEFEVNAGDELLFMVDPEGNDDWDGGKISVVISDNKQEEKKYSVTYKYDGEYPEAVTKTLPSEENQYSDGETVSAKDPTSKTVEGEKDGKQGTWTFEGWDAKSKKVEGADVEFTGTWAFTTEEVKYSVTYTYDGEYPQEVMDTLPTDETQYSNGETVTPKELTAETVKGEKDGEQGTWAFEGWDAESKKVDGADVEFTGTWKFTATRTNNADLEADFSGEQGKNGWHYGMCDWDGKNFEELAYDSANGRYYNNGKPELKADFVEPGNGRNAAYKWVAARDGEITVSGEYVKNEYDEAGTTGTVFRVRLNGEEMVFIGMSTKDKADKKSETFEKTFTVNAGDELLFMVDHEGNDAWDGGKISVVISDNGKTLGKKTSVAKPKTVAKTTPKVTKETVTEPEKEAAPEETEKPEEKLEAPKETADPVKPEETVEPVTEEVTESEETVEEVPEVVEPQEQDEETVEEPVESEITEETNE